MQPPIQYYIVHLNVSLTWGQVIQGYGITGRDEEGGQRRAATVQCDPIWLLRIIELIATLNPTVRIKKETGGEVVNIALRSTKATI